MPVRRKDTDRALQLLEEYCKKLKKPEEQQLKKAIKKVMGIFKSSLFQALLDITSVSQYILDEAALPKEEPPSADWRVAIH
ncbi:disks large 1 tumor suppressor protein-like [Alligator mississippiensis]|uniref:Disks large 1 tumor suppressor protein-like n=1 Tax=Alligator mississippiensis TaxID=8496 RepID=A0A151N555_ALLMI|nr:disks large 1 tumor suppressor protein-like [Alligator mississippiensis]